LTTGRVGTEFRNAAKEKDKKMNIYVGNLPYSFDDRELEAQFSEFGAVTSARVITDRDTGRSKGFGFVEMANDGEATEAINQLDGKDYNGRNIRVNEAKPREERPRGNSGGGRGPRY
jgi:RNA recognition motif-containing protein